jgi:hypothetical protein
MKELDDLLKLMVDIELSEGEESAFYLQIKRQFYSKN